MNFVGLKDEDLRQWLGEIVQSDQWVFPDDMVDQRGLNALSDILPDVSHGVVQPLRILCSTERDWGRYESLGGVLFSRLIREYATVPTPKQEDPTWETVEKFFFEEKWPLAKCGFKQGPRLGTQVWEAFGALTDWFALGDDHLQALATDLLRLYRHGLPLLLRNQTLYLLRWH